MPDCDGLSLSSFGKVFLDLGGVGTRRQREREKRVFTSAANSNRK